jgi:hypothetical protein
VIDIKADDIPFGIEIDIDSGAHFAGFRAWLGLQLNIEAVRFGVIMELHGHFLLKIPIEKCVVDRLAVLKCDHSQYTLFSVACVAYRAPMPYPPILLKITAQLCGDDGEVPCGVYLWPLS